MKKYQIGICDDQSQALEQLSHLLRDMGRIRGWQMDVKCYLDGQSLLKDVLELDVVFLDMEMPQEDGIEVGHKIRALNPNCSIIMESSYVDRIKEAFTIGAHRYVTKPYCSEELGEALESVLRKLPGLEMIELYYQRNIYMVCQRDIQYVRAMNGYTEYFSDNRLYRKEISLQDAENALDYEMFARVNRYLLVNLRYIEERNDGFYCGKLPFVISRRLRKKFEQRYIEYDLKYGR